MSARVYNRDFSRNKYTVEKSAKKYCGVCQKAGLSEKEYTSHFTKSVPGVKGIVICPTILNNECSFCFKLGHFKSTCPALAERHRIQKKRAVEDKRQYYKKQEQEQRATEVKKSTSSRNAFAALIDFSDDEEPVSLKRTHSVANEVKEEWPALSTVDAKSVSDKQSFASIAANPVPVKKIDPLPNICGFTVITKQGVQHPPPKAPVETKHISWFDMSDDEYEDEDDGYEDEDDGYIRAWSCQGNDNQVSIL